MRSVNWCLGKDGCKSCGDPSPYNAAVQCMVPTATPCLTAALDAESLAWIHQLILEPHSKAAYIYNVGGLQFDLISSKKKL